MPSDKTSNHARISEHFELLSKEFNKLYLDIFSSINSRLIFTISIYIKRIVTTHAFRHNKEKRRLRGFIFFIFGVVRVSSEIIILV